MQLSVENGRVVISPERTVRQGWEESFRGAGATRPAENLLDGIRPNRFDDDKWTW